MRYPLQDKVTAPQKDEFYHDILDGLSVYMSSSFILDILHAIREYPVMRLGQSLNLGQVSSKKWLLDSLVDAGEVNLGVIYILGGWYGVLGAMLLHDPRFSIDKVVSVDIDAQCKPIADALNRTHVECGKFESVTADVYHLDYSQMFSRSGKKPGKPDLLINTSCEHLSDFDRWYDRIPPQTLMVVQSNDYFSCDEHINCAVDLEAFVRQAPMSEVMYQGQMKLKKYTRFMQVGRK